MRNGSNNPWIWLFLAIATQGFNPSAAKAQVLAQEGEQLPLSPIEKQWTNDVMYGGADQSPPEVPPGNSPWEAFFKNMPLAELVNWGLEWMGRVPYQSKDSQPFVPASVQKIITATTALNVLGPEFRFTNSFQGKIDPATHTLTEAEFTVSGDPTWAHDDYDETLFTRLNKVVVELKRRGIKFVRGDIKISVIGTKIQYSRRPHEWRDYWSTECYAGIPTAVTLHGNCATFKIISPTAATWITRGVTTPLVVQLSAHTKRNAIPNIIPVLDPASEKVLSYRITGQYSVNQTTFDVPVHYNEDWLKKLLRIRLAAAKVIYKKEMISSPTSGTSENLFVDLSSKPLREILLPMLQDSINLVADRLFLQIAETSNAVADADPEIQMIDSLTDVSSRETSVIRDGSGLIPNNRITPKVLYRYLTALKNNSQYRPDYFNDFVAALPVSGISGTLTDRLNNIWVRGRVFAKTGTLDSSGASCLAGYFKNPTNQLEPFVIMTQSNPDQISKREVKSMEDMIVTQFAKDNQ